MGVQSRSPAGRVEVRREAWRNREVRCPTLSCSFDPGASPAGRPETAELAAAGSGGDRHGIDATPTTVALALMFDENRSTCSLIALARRDALYKTLHDARSQLRAALTASGRISTPLLTGAHHDHQNTMTISTPRSPDEAIAGSSPTRVPTCPATSASRDWTSTSRVGSVTPSTPMPPCRSTCAAAHSVMRRLRLSSSSSPWMLGPTDGTSTFSTEWSASKSRSRNDTNTV